MYSNAGTIEVDVGSSATVAASAFLTNLEEGTLQGGLWREIAGAGSCSLAINTDSVRVDAATISLSGAGAQFFSGFGALGVTPLEGTLNSIAAGGVLRLLASRNFTATNTLAVAGLLQLGGGTLQAPALSVALGGQVLGFGTVQDAVPTQAHRGAGRAPLPSPARLAAPVLWCRTPEQRWHWVALPTQRKPCWTTGRSRSEQPRTCN